MNWAAAKGPLLERSAELARMEAALGEARLGRGRFVVIEGPAGIGKTAVLAAARAAAAESGMRVLRSRGTELEREFAFGVVRQLVEPALAEASELERAELLQSTAGVAAALLGLPGAPRAVESLPLNVDPSFAILHGLYWMCANLAASSPVCMVIDDAHWADASSLRFLAFLLTRLDELPMGLLVATRPREAGTDADLLAAVMTDHSAEVVRIPPLTRGAVAHLVETTLGADPDPAFVEACLGATRGTPFLLRELVDALSEGGIAPIAEAARHVERIGARTVGRSIRLRLRRLPEPAGRLARALAILEQGELHQVAQLADLDPAETVDAFELLVDAGILEPGRPLTFIHPIVLSGLYSELSSAERARGHREAARLLAEQPGSEERVAQHLLASEPAAEAWSVQRLLDAAHTATRTGAPESAAHYLRRALAEPPEQDQRSSILLSLGIAEARAGLEEWRTHLEGAVESAPDDAARVDAAIVLGAALSRELLPADAVDVLDRAEASLDPGDRERRVLLDAVAAGVELVNAVPASSVAGRQKAARLLAETDASGPPELLAVAAFIATVTDEPAAVGAELALRSLAAGREVLARVPRRPWFSQANWFGQTAVTLLVAERYDQLRPLLDESIAEARESGDSGMLTIGLAVRGWLGLRLGDLTVAEVDTRTALAAPELRTPMLFRVLNGGILAHVLLEQGELAAADEALVPFAGEIERDSLTAAVLRLARGRVRVAQGRIDEGLADFLGVGRLATRAHVVCPGYLAWRSEAALAHLALGEREAARRLADEELELARIYDAPRVLGIANHAAGLVTGGDQGVTLLREAADALERSSARLERARTLTDLGAMLRRRNRRTEAREFLRDALDSAHRIGARALAERAETELRASGGRPRRIVLSGLESLTASERRIAELAGQGLSNREIAQTLFVTSRTVEGHLTNVFRKLQLDSRTKLNAALAEDGRVAV
jgi:DNA-binding CsgD family transcriptional regulator/tetratricopeptide (TPR) repeat protein